MAFISATTFLSLLPILSLIVHANAAVLPWGVRTVLSIAPSENTAPDPSHQLVITLPAALNPPKTLDVNNPDESESFAFNIQPGSGLPDPSAVIASPSPEPVQDPFALSVSPSPFMLDPFFLDPTPNVDQSSSRDPELIVDESDMPVVEASPSPVMLDPFFVEASPEPPADPFVAKPNRDGASVSVLGDGDDSGAVVSGPSMAEDPALERGDPTLVEESPTPVVMDPLFPREEPEKDPALETPEVDGAPGSILLDPLVAESPEPAVEDPFRPNGKKKTSRETPEEIAVVGTTPAADVMSDPFVVEESPEPSRREPEDIAVVKPTPVSIMMEDPLVVEESPEPAMEDPFHRHEKTESAKEKVSSAEFGPSRGHVVLGDVPDVEESPEPAMKDPFHPYYEKQKPGRKEPEEEFTIAPSPTAIVMDPFV